MISIGNFLYNTETTTYNIKNLTNVNHQCSFGTRILIEDRIFYFIDEYGFDTFMETYLLAEVTKVPVQGISNAYEYKTVLFLLKVYWEEELNYELTRFKQ